MRGMYGLSGVFVTRYFFNRLSKASDGLNLGKVMSGKDPYYQYMENDEVKSALLRNEPPERPRTTDGNIDLVDDQLWELITGCCRPNAGDRLTVPEIQKFLVDMRIKDDRADAQGVHGVPIMSLRKRPDIEWDHVKQLLGKIQVRRSVIERSFLITCDSTSHRSSFCKNRYQD